jgi:hypothetical protein
MTDATHATSADRLMPLSSAERMRRHRKRRRDGLRCLWIELREVEVEALVRRGTLSRDERTVPAALRKALYAYLDANLR